jgi:hypothetical protein
MVDGKLVLATINITQSIKDQLAATYKMKDMGEMDWYLGMRCKRNKLTAGAIKLDQSKYIDDVIVVGKFHDDWLGSERNRTVPMQPNLVFYKNGPKVMMTDSLRNRSIW